MFALQPSIGCIAASMPIEASLMKTPPPLMKDVDLEIYLVD